MSRPAGDPGNDIPQHLSFLGGSGSREWEHSQLTAWSREIQKPWGSTDLSAGGALGRAEQMLAGPRSTCYRHWGQVY